MYKKRHSAMLRIVAMVMVIVLTVPMNASAAVSETVQPYASYYLNSYSAYVYPAGSGRIQVYFSVKGVGYMDEIGTLQIALYESKDKTTWTWLKTYTHNNYSSMLGYDDYYHGGYVSYQGIGGRYYKAYVCVWAGKDGDGDTRYFWTSAQQAI